MVRAALHCSNGEQQHCSSIKTPAVPSGGSAPAFGCLKQLACVTPLIPALLHTCLSVDLSHSCLFSFPLLSPSLQRATAQWVLLCDSMLDYPLLPTFLPPNFLPPWLALIPLETPFVSGSPSTPTPLSPSNTMRGEWLCFFRPY